MGHCLDAPWLLLCSYDSRKQISLSFFFAQPWVSWVVRWHGMEVLQINTCLSSWDYTFCSCNDCLAWKAWLWKSWCLALKGWRLASTSSHTLDLMGWFCWQPGRSWNGCMSFWIGVWIRGPIWWMLNVMKGIGVGSRQIGHASPI